MKPSIGARHMNSHRLIVAVVETGSHFMKDGRAFGIAGAG